MCMETLMQKCKSLKDFTVKELICDNNSFQYYCGYTKAPKANKEYAKYYIFDLKGNVKNDIIYSYLKNENNFDHLQESIFENDFFRYSTDLKFNLYLIIIVNSLNDVPIIKKILKDYKYGRKLVFEEQDAQHYFNMQDILEREKSPIFWDSLPDVYSATDEKEKLITEFFKINMLMNFSGKNNNFIAFPSHLLKFKKPKERYSYYHHMLFHDYLHSNSVKTLWRTGSRKIEKTTEDLLINKINSLYMRNFRNFGSEQTLEFGKANLFYGDNGAGKTSVIEAIEYALTGSMSKEKKFGRGSETSNFNIEVSCENKNNGVTLFSNKINDYKTLGKLWYNVEDKFNLNQAFCKYNYFDIRGAFRFAISEIDNNSSGYSIYDFIIDKRTLHFSEYINEIQSQLDMLSKEIDDKLKDVQKSIKKNPIKGKNKRVSNINDDEIYKIIALSSDTLLDKDLLPSILKSEQDILIKQQAKCRELIEKFGEIPNVKTTVEGILCSISEKISNTFLLLTSNRDYAPLTIKEGNLVAAKAQTDKAIPFSQMSTGQKVCFALSTMFAIFISNENAPNFIILDEPVSNLDDLHLLNLLDVLRQLALNGTQIFFTTANPNTAKLFRRKFSFLGDDFLQFNFSDENEKTEVTVQTYKNAESGVYGETI